MLELSDPMHKTLQQRNMNVESNSRPGTYLKEGALCHAPPSLTLPFSEKEQMLQSD